MVILPCRLQYRWCVIPVPPSVIAPNPRTHQVREPLDKIDPNNQHIDAWEVILYVLALSFSLESGSFALPPWCTLTGLKFQTTSKLVDLPKSLRDLVLRSLRDIDLQADAFCDLALVLVLELR